MPRTSASVARPALIRPAATATATAPRASLSPRAGAHGSRRHARHAVRSTMRLTALLARARMTSAPGPPRSRWRSQGHERRAHLSAPLEHLFDPRQDARGARARCVLGFQENRRGHVRPDRRRRVPASSAKSAEKHALAMSPSGSVDPGCDAHGLPRGDELPGLRDRALAARAEVGGPEGGAMQRGIDRHVADRRARAPGSGTLRGSRTGGPSRRCGA